MLTPSQHAVVAMVQKTCSKCGERKPMTEYHKQKGTSDGLRSACKACKLKADSEYAAAHPRPTATHLVHSGKVAQAVVAVKPEYGICACCEKKIKMAEASAVANHGLAMVARIRQEHGLDTAQRL